LKQNQQKLAHLTETFIKRILLPESLAYLPRGIRAIAGFTAEYARMYAGDRLCPLVGGFLMLRLFNPSLVTPEAFGLLPSGMVPSKSARRNFTLISKVLQNLSNGLLFGNKEPYMNCMNPLIEKYNADFRNFLHQVAHDEEASSPEQAWIDCKSSEAKPLEPSDFDEKHCTLFHSLLVQHRGRLLEILNETLLKTDLTDFSQEEEIFRLLDELPEPSVKCAKPSPPIQPISYLTPTEKSGNQN
jgi:hypothetical protein